MRTSLSSISWQDVYNYQRCPKIVSFKAAGFRTRVLEKPPKRRVEPALVGKLGEAVVREAIAGAKEGREPSPRLIEQWLREELRRLSRVEPIGAYESYIHESLAGIREIVPKLRERYGWMEIIGKGQSKNVLAPSMATPDMVALGERTRRPFLVEVKTTDKVERQHKAQVTFYNSISHLVGGLIFQERLSKEEVETKPLLRALTPTNTLLIYPRLGRYEEVAERVKLTRLAKPIWEAKQLGLVGKQPHAERGEQCKRCAWRGFCSPAKEDEMEPLKPLPLVFAKGLIETGFDLDFYWIHNYIRGMIGEVIYRTKERARIQASLITLDTPKKYHDAWDILWKANSIELVDFIANKFGVGIDQAKAILEPLYMGGLEEKKRIRKRMASEVEPWRKLLTEKQLERWTLRMISRAKALASFPRSSTKLVNRAWQRWD